MKTINIAKDLKLPIDAVTQTFAIMAKRGVGKTHTASVMAEEMLKQGQPVIVYDPTSAWWGLKSSADGKKPGFPIVIFGGEHADVPLEENAGEMIATVIVERRLSAILDCGLMRKGARIRFMTAFCEALYHKNREPIHFFIDEAQTVAPQNLKAMPEIARLVGALEDIILQGRRRGLGVTVISPRPAILNTSIRSACEVLIAMQIVGPHDRKAIQDWIDVHGDDVNAAKEMMSTLSSLKRGEAWVWSPAWLEIFVRTKFRSRETFDSSATPEIGNRVIAPSRMADVDLEKLGAEIAATVERVKADDPKALRARITALERELSAKQVAPKTPPAKVKRVEVPILKHGEIKQLKLFIDTIANSAKHYNDAKYTMESALGNAETIVKEINSILQKAMNSTKGETAPTQQQRKEEPGNRAGLLSTENLPRGQQKIIDALAELETFGVVAPHRLQLGMFSGYNLTGGSGAQHISDLGKLGFVSIGNGVVSLTGPGRDAANPSEAPNTCAELHERVMRKLSVGQRKIAQYLIGIYPEPVSRSDLGAAVGYNLTGGSGAQHIADLVTAGIAVIPSKAFVKASGLLFPELLK